MGFDAHIESPPGTNYSSLHFAQGQSIRLAGSLVGDLGIPIYGDPITVTIYGKNGAVDLHGVDYVDFLGHWYVDFDLPFIDAQATITCSEGGGGIGEYEPIVFNIAIGNATPEPPPNPNPTEWWKWLLIGGGIVLVGVVVVPRLAPQVTKYLPVGRS